MSTTSWIIVFLSISVIAYVLWWVIFIRNVKRGKPGDSFHFLRDTGEVKAEVSQNWGKLTYYRTLGNLLSFIPVTGGVIIIFLALHYNYQSNYLIGVLFVCVILFYLIKFFAFKQKITDLVNRTKEISPKSGKWFQFSHGYSESPVKSFFFLIIAVPIAGLLFVLLLMLILQIFSK